MIRKRSIQIQPNRSRNRLSVVMIVRSIRYRSISYIIVSRWWTKVRRDNLSRIV